MERTKDQQIADLERQLQHKEEELGSVVQQRDRAEGFRKAADEALQRCHGHAEANHSEISYLRRANVLQQKATIWYAIVGTVIGAVSTLIAKSL